jgi:hypothetical protein
VPIKGGGDNFDARQYPALFNIARSQKFNVGRGTGRKAACQPQGIRFWRCRYADIHSVILLPQSKPDDEQKRRDNADEHPCVAGPLKAVHFGLAFSPS